MELSKQCVNLEIAKRLKELGVPQESLFYWIFRKHQNLDIHRWDILSIEEIKEIKVWDNKKLESVSIKPLIEQRYSAFTVGELGELLPRRITYMHFNNGQWYAIKNKIDFCADTEVDARAKMLIYLLEKGLIKI